jgi:DNA primase
MPAPAGVGLGILFTTPQGILLDIRTEITEELCPPEEAVSVSDLSPQALFYYGQDDLKNKFIVIGEKHGSEAADYPLRELISRKSITKAIPMKDPATGQIKTVTITVNGPIALVETSTSAEINPENLNRCFVIGIDESEEQTGEIHKFQRRSYTLDGFLTQHKRDEIINRHVYAQRLLRKVQVFNPFAELLTFPTSKLRSRRDNEKLLRLITAICFLHQYQRKVKTYKFPSGQEFEYIECTVDDYRIAYDLLSDGVLENTLDDLPRPARALLNLIKKYLDKRAAKEDVAAERITFERKEIREYTSWSFAQVRNNFRILKDYEYIKLIKSQRGMAHQYKLNGGYAGIDLLHTILSPVELKEKLRQEKIIPSSSEADEAHEPEPEYGLNVLTKVEPVEHQMNIRVFSR